MEKMVSISLWKKNWKERKVTRYNSIMKTKILFTHEDVANIAEQGRKMGKIDTIESTATLEGSGLHFGMIH